LIGRFSKYSWNARFISEFPLHPVCHANPPKARESRVRGRSRLDIPFVPAAELHDSNSSFHDVRGLVQSRPVREIDGVAPPSTWRVSAFRSIADSHTLERLMRPISIFRRFRDAIQLPWRRCPRLGGRIPTALALTLALMSGGCMHRRLTVRSDPPGAAVLVDGDELGFTPVSLDYNYYGTREITLVKDGYKTVTLNQKISTPWYQVFPLEFFSDNLAFTHLRDKREILYTLQPDELVPTGDVLERANNLRSNALRSEMPLPGR
jgi:PEGA domain